jgi:small-conductance mechanosensitive channel
MEVPSSVNFDILKQFKAAGLNFAYPTQTIFVKNEKAK